MVSFQPAREQDAYFVIRGFVYQVNVTVLRWLTLKDGEVLELERGEDIDHLSKSVADGSSVANVSSPLLSGTDATDAGNHQDGQIERGERLLEQIKCRADSVTITSARATIANYAAHRRANPGLKVRFRYTTNAKVGTEKPYLLPSVPQAGIFVWRAISAGDLQAKDEAIALSEMRQALAGLSCPDEFDSKPARLVWLEFQNYIRSIEDDELREFIRDFEWGTGEQSHDEIIGKICDELTQNELFMNGADPAETHRRLFLHVFQTLSKPGLKRLTPDDLNPYLVTPPSQEERQLLRHIVEFLFKWQDDLHERIALLEERITETIRESVRDGAAEITEHLDQKFAQQNVVVVNDERFNDVRHLMTSGKWKTALGQLKRLRQSLREEERITPENRRHLMGRIAGAEGVCQWHLDEYVEAQKLFEEELRWQPDAARGKAHLAMSLQESVPKRAIELAEEARADAELWPNATGTLLIALYNQVGWAAVVARMRQEPSMKQYAPVLLSLASILLKSNRFRAAQYYAQQALTSNLDPQLRPAAYRLMADAMTIPIRKAQHAHIHGESDSRFFARSSSIWNEGWSESAKKLWQGAEEALSNFLSFTSEWEIPIRRQVAFTQRAEARYMLDLDDEALQDCEHVLSDLERDVKHPSYYQAYLLKALVLLQMGRKAAAVEAFRTVKEEVDDEQTRFKATLFGAQVLRELQEWQQVIEWLVALWQPDAGKRDLISVGAELLEAYHRLKQVDKVAAVSESLKSIYGDDPVAWCILSEQARREGRRRMVIRYLETAHRTTKKGQWPRSIESQIAFNLSIEHAMRGHYHRAAILLRPIIDPNRPNNALYNYLVCLDKTGRHKQALELSRRARNNGPAIFPHSILEAAIAEEVGDLPLAAQLRRELSQADTQHIEHSLRLAYIEQELGKPDASRAAIEKISFDVVAGNPQDLMRLASARADFGMPHSLEWAYRARKLAFTDADIHFAYIRLFHYLPSDESERYLSISKVEAECAVHLKRHGTVEIIVVTANPIDGIQDVRQWHIEDPRARQLMGKKVGDSVAFQHGPFSGQRLAHEIVGIQSKYVYAVEETTNLFKQGVLYHERFEVNHHEPGNVEQIIEQMNELMARGAESSRYLNEFYRRFAAPISTIALLRNRTLLDSWHDGFGCQFYVQDGTREELTKATSLLEQLDKQPSEACQVSCQTPVVLDTTALLFTFLVGASEHLAKAFAGRLLVPQAVRDEFAAVVRESQRGPAAAGYLFGDGRTLGYQETTEDFHASRRENWQKILRFIDECTEVVPVYSIASCNQADRQIYTRPTLAAVLLAKERQCPLMSDDLRVRLFGDTRHKVAGFWTLAFLTHLAQRNELNAVDFAESIRRLSLAGQGVWPQTGRFLCWLCEKNDWKVNQEVQWFFDQPNQWSLYDDVATQNIATFLWLLKQQRIDSFRKKALLRASLEALVKGRGVASTLRLLKHHLRKLAVAYIQDSNEVMWPDFLLFQLIAEIDGVAPSLSRLESKGADQEVQLQMKIE